jgi:hypothetical protein
MNKKRLYWNSCSFLDTDKFVDKDKLLYKIFNPEFHGSHRASIGGSSNESIFRRTLIDISKNNFDFAIIAWSHPERFFVIDAYNELDYNKLREDGDRQFFATKWDESMYGYKHGIPHNSSSNVEILKLEPKGTDDTIIYTISLHNFLKQKNIPHLFLNMGKLDSDVLWARESWLKEIDSKNYLSLNDDDTILEKMKFSFVEHFLKLGENELIKDKDVADLKKIHKVDEVVQLKNTNPYTIDIAGHLSDLAFKRLDEIIYKHIVKNNLV